MKLPTTDPKQKLPFACPCGCMDLEATAQVTLQLKDGGVETKCENVEDRLYSSIITCTKCKFSAPGCWFRIITRSRADWLQMLLEHVHDNFEVFGIEDFLSHLLKCTLGLELKKAGDDVYSLVRAAPVEEKKA